MAEIFRSATTCCPSVSPDLPPGKDARVPCREQLAEAMHRIDALLAHVDDVRHTASRETAVAAKNADAIENRLKCASGWQPPAHAAPIAKLAQKFALPTSSPFAPRRQLFPFVSDAIKQMPKLRLWHCASSNGAVHLMQ